MIIIFVPLQIITTANTCGPGSCMFLNFVSNNSLSWTICFNRRYKILFLCSGCFSLSLSLTVLPVSYYFFIKYVELKLLLYYIWFFKYCVQVIRFHCWQNLIFVFYTITVANYPKSWSFIILWILLFLNYLWLISITMKIIRTTPSYNIALT